MSLRNSRFVNKITQLIGAWKCSSDGAAHMHIASSVFGSQVENSGSEFAGIANAVNDGVIYTSPPIVSANNVFIERTSGTVYVEVTPNFGDNWFPAVFRTITNTGVVTENDTQIAANEIGVLQESLVGKFTNFRIKTFTGAGSSNARGRYGVE